MSIDSEKFAEQILTKIDGMVNAQKNYPARFPKEKALAHLAEIEAGCRKRWCELMAWSGWPEVAGVSGGTEQQVVGRDDDRVAMDCGDGAGGTIRFRWTPEEARKMAHHLVAMSDTIEDAALRAGRA